LKRKEKVPVGYTGWKATKRVTQKQLDNWLSSQNPKSNVAHQPTPDYIGIDVDLYKPAARAQWDAIIEEMGPLPDTWTSSARDDGSGIRHFRLREEHQDLAWPGTVGDAIQFCHVGHRYSPQALEAAQRDNAERKLWAAAAALEEHAAVARHLVGRLSSDEVATGRYREAADESAETARMLADRMHDRTTDPVPPTDG